MTGTLTSLRLYPVSRSQQHQTVLTPVDAEWPPLKRQTVVRAWSRHSFQHLTHVSTEARRD